VTGDLHLTGHAAGGVPRDRAQEAQALGRHVHLDRRRLAGLGMGGLAGRERDVVRGGAGVGEGDGVATGLADLDHRGLEAEVERLDLDRAEDLALGRRRGRRSRARYRPTVAVMPAGGRRERPRWALGRAARGQHERGSDDKGEQATHDGRLPAQ
jgi:hypothetical protein